MVFFNEKSGVDPGQQSPSLFLLPYANIVLCIIRTNLKAFQYYILDNNSWVPGLRKQRTYQVNLHRFLQIFHL